ncbi:MAG: DUF58 domain-containing protein [Myxococcota bacterium]
MIDPALLDRLTALSLVSLQRRPGQSGGQRASRRRGTSQEFADHRPYVPGDDLRHLDWHLYGRLDTLWVKLFEAEDDQVVQCLVDASASMRGDKLTTAKQLAAAFAWVSLHHGDRVSTASLTDGVVRYRPARRGRGQAPAIFSELEAIEATGPTDLGQAVARLPRQRGAGTALLFTDFLFANDPEPLLRRLLARHTEVWALHLLSPADVRPNLMGDVVLVDAETGEEFPTTIDEAMLDRVEATMIAWADEIEEACRKLGVSYVRIWTATPLEELLFGQLRAEGALR